MTTAVAKKQKYNAQRVTTAGGLTFDSRKEEKRYWHLKKDPTVVAIEVHPSFEVFQPFAKCIHCGTIFKHKGYGKCPGCGQKLIKFRGITYVADFKVTYADGHIEIEDVKGVETEAFKLKKKLFEASHPNLTLRIVR